MRALPQRLPAALLALALAGALGCAGGAGPGDPGRVDDYYGGSIHRNSFPETYGTWGVVRPGRPY